MLIRQENSKINRSEINLLEDILYDLPEIYNST